MPGSKAYERKSIRQIMPPGGNGNTDLPGFKPGIDIIVRKNNQGELPGRDFPVLRQVNGHIPKQWEENVAAARRSLGFARDDKMRVLMFLFNSGALKQLFQRGTGDLPASAG